jgi:hypothetical protein
MDLRSLCSERQSANENLHGGTSDVPIMAKKGLACIPHPLFEQTRQMVDGERRLSVDQWQTGVEVSSSTRINHI